MRTLKLKAQADSDGVVRLEIPTGFSNHELEIVVVMSPIQPEPTDAMGYPIGYFEETYGSLADDPIERHQPPYPDARDEVE